MLAPHRPRLLPPIPPVIRFAILGAFVAALFYVALIWQPAQPAGDTTPPVEVTVAVPQIDRTILAQALDSTRAQRLVLDPEPLRHLLGVAIDVGPSVAAALGLPDRPVPIEDLQKDIEAWRGRWLWYEGVLEELAGPREGHPVNGYSIYEATVRLADKQRAMVAFSIPPSNDIKRGSWVRIEGFLMKLRDTTYPLDITSAPMLVGREIQRDYEDWGPVTELDASLLAKIDDSTVWPGDTAWHTIEEDQTQALWHLAAFARDTADQRSLADWRKIGTLNEGVHQAVVDNEIVRGTPVRVFGTLIRRSTIAAPANPAGVKFWTVAWLQVREYGGQLIPVWVPKRVAELPLRADLEVRGFYYRRLIYESQDNQRRRVPLFVAADLDPFHLEVDQTMRQVSIALAIAGLVFFALIWWAQRRATRQTLNHGREMDERRRRRREKIAMQVAKRPS